MHPGTAKRHMYSVLVTGYRILLGPYFLSPRQCVAQTSRSSSRCIVVSPHYLVSLPPKRSLLSFFFFFFLLPLICQARKIETETAAQSCLAPLPGHTSRFILFVHCAVVSSSLLNGGVRLLCVQCLTPMVDQASDKDPRRMEIRIRILRTPFSVQMQHGGKLENG